MGRPRSGESWQQYAERRHAEEMQEQQEREELEQKEVEVLTPTLLRALKENLSLELNRVKPYGYDRYALEIKILFAGEVIAREETSLED